MIDVEHLSKDYGTMLAVDDVSFAVGKGEVVGFLGPNGAGKSTTLRILAGFLGATAGVVRVAGFDVAQDSLRARRALGYMPEATPLYPELKVREYLAFRAALKGVARREQKQAVSRALEQAAVADVAETLIGHLSKGYRQRVGLADALISNPPLLILDEPTAGLDPNQILEVRRLMRELGESHTLLLSTHILSEVEAVCDRAIVIARGKLVAEGTLAELKSRRLGDELVLGVRGTHALVERALRPLGTLKGFVVAPESDSTVSVRLTLAEGTNADEAAEAAVAALVGAGAGVRSVSRPGASLEQVFAELTAGERSASAEAASGASPPATSGDGA